MTPIAAEDSTGFVLIDMDKVRAIEFSNASPDGPHAFVYFDGLDSPNIYTGELAKQLRHFFKPRQNLERTLKRNGQK